jgi:zinc/manganese transport system substrate-binding protein
MKSKELENKRFSLLYLVFSLVLASSIMLSSFGTSIALADANNQKAYLEYLFQNGSDAQKMWANQSLYLSNLYQTGSDGEKTWAKVQAEQGEFSIYSLDSNGTADTGNSITSAGSSASTNAAPIDKIKIVAAENFYGEVAQAVGGDSVAVTSILSNPNIDPHAYEPTVETAKTVNDARVIIYTGIGYDAWMEKLINANSSASSKTVINVGNDRGKKEGDNPHIWYDPTTIPILAVKIADELAKIYPDQDKAFHQRAKDYIASLQPLYDKIQKIQQTSAVIDVSEPVFDYMAAALNMTVGDPKFAKAIEENVDPAPRDVAQLQSDIKGKQIKLFVYNIQTQSPTVEKIVQLAKSSNIPIVEVTETEPIGKNYLQWMMDQLDQIGKALGV